MITTEKLNEIWNSINKYSLEFLNEEFEQIAPCLVEFLVRSKLDSAEFEIETFDDLPQKGSAISFNQFAGEKQLEIRYKKNSSYELILSIFEDNGEAFVYKYKLPAEEINIIPQEIQHVMQKVRETGEPMVFKNSLSR